jgi:hypothetical protein
MTLDYRARLILSSLLEQVGRGRMSYGTYTIVDIYRTQPQDEDDFHDYGVPNVQGAKIFGLHEKLQVDFVEVDAYNPVAM